MQNVIVNAENVWDYFQKHKIELKKSEHIIAKNEKYSVEILIKSEEGLPCFSVMIGGCQYDEDIAVSANDCRAVAEKLYDYYLTESDEEPAPGCVDQEDMISERELELDDAFVILLDTLIEDDVMIAFGKKADEIIEDVKDHVLEYLYKKHEISVRRPMVLEDVETGEDFFEEYPYDSIIFEDKDDNLHKK